MVRKLDVTNVLQGRSRMLTFYLLTVANPVV